jgi:F420-dependent oxidoreductase-like protein
MLEIAIMIEGQDGLNWPRWQKIARTVEQSGFAGLYRSDHFTNSRPPDLDSLELWVSLAWLASHTQRIQFGPLVTPFSFRHPTLTARMAAAVDDLSGGRLVLGLGAGWQAREHENFGHPLLDGDARFNRLAEGLEVVSRLLKSDAPVDFQGEYYRLHDAIQLPRPARKGGPPILLGGNGEHRTLPLAARYAVEWNGIYLTSAEFSRLNSRLDDLLKQDGRSPAEVRRSLMTGIVFGKDSQEVERKVIRRTLGKKTAAGLRRKGVIVGSAGEIREQLSILEDSGVQRVMLQWLDMDDTEGLEALAEGIL